jgi:hypothetical protein
MMTTQLRFLTAVILLVSTHGLALAEAGQDSAASEPFEVASVHLEQNATDGDLEVVFEVKGNDDGLAKLAVVSPDGRTVIDFTAADDSALGIRQFRLETPEPTDVKRLKSAYPEGVYSFTGATTGGVKLHGESTLSHRLPATVSFLRPQADEAGDRDVSVKNLVIAWTSVENLAAHIIEIEQDELGVKLTARLPGSAAKFAVPDGFLLPGTEYQLGIGTVTDDGNTSFVETSFTTAGE